MGCVVSSASSNFCITLTLTKTATGEKHVERDAKNSARAKTWSSQLDLPIYVHGELRLASDLIIPIFFAKIVRLSVVMWSGQMGILVRLKIRESREGEKLSPWNPFSFYERLGRRLFTGDFSAKSGNRTRPKDRISVSASEQQKPSYNGVASKGCVLTMRIASGKKIFWCFFLKVHAASMKRKSKNNPK